MVLLPLVAEHVDLPLIGPGGICDARTMAAAFVLGAVGVQMGTRLLACAESPVHDNLKQAVLAADETGTVLLPLGGGSGARMMRVIRTAAAEQIDTGGSPDGAAPTRVHTLYFDGDMTASVANTGHVAGRIADIRPAAQIIGEMWAGCRELLTATVASMATVGCMCTRVVYLGNNDRVVTGRSMDWKFEIGTNLWVMPRGVERSGAAGRAPCSGRRSTAASRIRL
jgi:enoyl-[acyl-carrier protein] reductase II